MYGILSQKAKTPFVQETASFYIINKKGALGSKIFNPVYKNIREEIGLYDDYYWYYNGTYYNLLFN